MDRRRPLWNKVENEHTKQNTECNIGTTKIRVPFSCSERPKDTNEINLDDDSDHDKDNSCNSYSDKRLKLMEVSGYSSSNQALSSWNEIGTVSQILVLGSGCAAPAPLRGSSGYALYTPPSACASSSTTSLVLTGLIECGEGCLTSLSRFTPQQSTKRFRQNLSSLDWVWISHAHFDHYGELPLLIHQLNKI